MRYICDLCGYTSSYKKDVVKHLRKSNRCSTDDVDRESIIANLKGFHDDSTRIVCQTCDNTFAYKYNLDRHICIGAKKDGLALPDYSILNTRAPVLIVTNDFGKEDTCYIDRDTLLRRLLLHDGGVMEMIDDIYFNPDHPENMTIRIKSHKRGTAEIRKDGAWNVAYLKDVVPRMVRKSSALLSDLLGHSECAREHPGVVSWLNTFHVGKPFREIVGQATLSLINKTRQ
jgi:hypothetical protein